MQENEIANNGSKSQEAILTINRYEEIIKIQNKRTIGYISKQGQLLNVLNTFLMMLVKVDQ